MVGSSVAAKTGTGGKTPGPPAVAVVVDAETGAGAAIVDSAGAVGAGGCCCVRGSVRTVDSSGRGTDSGSGSFMASKDASAAGAGGAGAVVAAGRDPLPLDAGAVTEAEGGAATMGLDDPAVAAAMISSRLGCDMLADVGSC